MTTNYSEPDPLVCDETYSSSIEILKYLLTISYLIPGGILHLFILHTILVTRRGYFKGSSFFAIFALDSVSSIIIVFIDSFYGRLFLYVPPLCPIVGPFFWASSLIPKIYFYLSVHTRLSKCVAHICMVLNRMTCVLMPTYYGQIWRKLTKVSLVIICILPLGGTWNIIISPRFYVLPSYGGFAISYVRAIPWASSSLFQSIYILTALVFTFICTSVTLYKLISLSDRIKSAEKSLCFSNIYISLTFLAAAASQALYAFCTSCMSSDLLFTAQFLAFDMFTVGSAVILFWSNSQIRGLILPSKAEDDRIFRVQTINNSFTH
ncbi:Serpentine receptor class gamma-15 [Caenorhabditis elegans]|uniref:Serpentine receptor class gamma-15 n=1 Tax=Caenorhabditis elegans TaxID=6239 RepID=SRG15_CAEEL|nr:Serpentine receptor class gamma-15 [Caenorhabditis elegans]Q18428.2 RecName: Full=Serpentine receptor class gamma-15; Short=Protein srg-15 [Caenorhabditis elegans]CAA91262.2 Serpentine receptor class gamma-15 [Caenorhabditis elegans]|eukprot:NP_495851.2 Serpentine receptor class gamma-15 [Caenorhabditis elegans]